MKSSFFASPGLLLSAFREKSLEPNSIFRCLWRHRVHDLPGKRAPEPSALCVGRGGAAPAPRYLQAWLYSDLEHRPRQGLW
jgi:hypothetical protein